MDANEQFASMTAPSLALIETRPFALVRPGFRSSRVRLAGIAIDDDRRPPSRKVAFAKLDRAGARDVSARDGADTPASIFNGYRFPRGARRRGGGLLKKKKREEKTAPR